MTDSPAAVRWQLWIVAFGFFMQTLDTTIVNTALPSMAVSLNESPLHMHAVIVAYVLTVAMVLPASGWLADRLGVRNVFLSAILLFSLGSLLCARSETLNELLLSRVAQGIGGAMMVPIGRLTVMKLVPRDQYMAAMTFVTLPGQIGPLMGPSLGGFLVQYASWHWIFLINIPVGIIGAIATGLLMPNFTMPARRFDLRGFFCLVVCMATLTLALDGQKSLGFSPAMITALIGTGSLALAGYWLHARHNEQALFNLRLFNTHSFTIGLFGGWLARIGSGMLPFMTPVFLQLGLGYSPFHAGLMMIPLVMGNMGMKRLVVKIVNRFGYRNVLIASTLMLAIASLLFALVAMMNWRWLMPCVLFIVGMVNGIRFSTMNTLTLKDLPDDLASGGNSLLSMSMQLSTSMGVSIAGLLLGLFAHQHLVAGTAETNIIFLYTYLCMAAVMAFPALIFSRAPADILQQATLPRRS
ncbi:MFS transporter [Musicola paradisiaca]|uniref:Putative multidrug resistance protein MdtD n=1 Tax=Musicola paradisiaca (strain Ech703) TaxID=579405 RepID=C6CAI4_MUSP7|nr:MFS transporter [Musicola paradisiaca]ACS86482.1 major facilitator superfamily MFS_1 [Musicola paradisiaca Ech703]